MPTPHTLSKGVTEAQFTAFETARKKAGLTATAAKERAFRDFCEAQGVVWPATAPHGGKRVIRRPVNHCPRCDSLRTKFVGDVPPVGREHDPETIDNMLIHCLDCGHEFPDYEGDLSWIERIERPVPR